MAAANGGEAAHRTAFLCTVFFASGASALLFETVWFRMAGLTFGNSVWASSMVLAAFMAGLAIGNGFAATAGRRTARPLRFYAMLEITVGVSGLALVVALPLLTAALVPLFRPLIDRPALLNTVRLVIAGALIVVPTAAMGATLPLLVRALSRDERSFGATLGLLYGWNTAGAVAGALAGEMALIEAFGLRGTAVVAAVLNGGAAIAALAVARRTSDAPPVVAATSAPADGPAARLLAAAFLSGATLLALEVVWFRFLLLFIDGTSLAFALMLAVILLGIALGGLIAARIFRTDADAHRWTAAIAFGCGVVTALCFAGFAPGPPPERTAQGLIVRDSLAALRLMLLTSAGSGMLFTLIGRGVQKRIGDHTRAAALVTLANTIGAMLGALCAGFVLLPAIGMERSMFALICVYAVVAILTIDRGEKRAWVATALVFAAAIAFFPFGVVRRTFVPMITEPYRRGGEQVIAIRESPGETNTYLRKDILGEPHSYRLMTNGISMSATTVPALRYMSLFVDLPMALHADAKRALLISYGVGTTAKSLTNTAGLQSIDVVDISRDVLEMNRLRRFEGGHPLDDPRVRVHIEDGRFFLLTTADRFDLISAEPPPPKYAGIVNLYSREYFQLIHDRLSDGGFASYWLPIYQLHASEGKAIIKAFCGAFDDCSLWSGAGPEMILLGSRGARPVSRNDFERRWRDPATARVLSEIGVESPALLGSLFIAGSDWLGEFTANAEPLIDDRPLRLSSRPVAEFDPAFEVLLDVPAAQRRFQNSAWIARVWPADLRERTIDAFLIRDIADRYFSSLGRPGSETMFREVAFLLTRSPYRSLPKILMGSDARLEEIAADARARSIAAPAVSWIEGVRALSERRFGDAAALLKDASRRAPDKRAWARDAAFAESLSAANR